MPFDDMAWKRPDHPWLDEFERDPETQFDEIIRGVALIHPYGLADPQTVIPSLFGPLHPDHPLMAALDYAALGWLEARRRLPLEERRDFGLKRYWADVVEALAIAQRVRLPVTRAALRERYFEFLQWVEGNRFSSSIDPRARLWLALTPDQPTPRFRSLWRRICKQTGEGLYPDHYLNIGLLGLRRLPGREDAVLPEVLAGLAAWAVSLPDGKKPRQSFMQQWRALNWLYTQPGRRKWQGWVAPIVRAHRDRAFATWWADDLKFAPGGKPAAGHQTAPDVGEVKRLVAQLNGQSVARLQGDIRRLVGARLRYAETTGDSGFLVKTAGNIGGRIIEAAPALTEELVTQALDWEPNNPVLWNLWGRALLRQGRTRFAEAVFWEAARRFPDNEPTLVELARLLLGVGRTSEAEAVLREAVRRFPNGEPSHVELARLLARREEWREAIALLRGFIARHPDQPIAINTLGHILVDSGDPDAARPLLDRLRDLRTDREIGELTKKLARAASGPVSMPEPDYRTDLPDRDEATDVDGVAEHRPLTSDALVTRADFGLSAPAAPLLTPQRQDELRADLRALLAEQPDHAYARIVAFDRLPPASEDEARGILADHPRLYELRLLAGLRRRDAPALTELALDMPEREPVTLLALAALDAADATQRRTAAPWLVRHTPPASDLLGGYVHRAARAALERAGIDLTDPEAVAEALPGIAGALTTALPIAARLVGTQDRAA